MRLPHPPSGTRFFGQVYSGVCECPRCGELLAWAGRSGGRRQAVGHWDRRTSILQCGYCGLRGFIGLLWWPVHAIGPATHKITVPRDQVPNERQLAQLRAMGGGLWMPDQARKPAFRPNDTNITAACSCAEGTENTLAGDPECPIHGGDQVPEFVPPEEE